MIDFLKKLGIKTGDDTSKNIAKERLQFILIHDRIKLSPEEMKSMKKELLEVLAKYIEVDDTQIKMEVDRNEGMTALVANFPIKKSG
ncbi:MAG: cell division topological specificity factor MinE [Halanaerobiaceae bacterium]